MIDISSISGHILLKDGPVIIKNVANFNKNSKIIDDLELNYDIQIFKKLLPCNYTSSGILNAEGMTVKTLGF